MPTNPESENRAKRVAFVTIGQSPREDVLDEILPLLGADIEVREYGVLDGMSAEEIGALAPKGEEDRLCTRLGDGSEVTTTKAWTLRRLQGLMDRLDGEAFDLVVLLCTGYFEGLVSKTPMVEAREVMDSAVRDQAGYRPALVTHASPYSDARLAAAGAELGQVDLIATHCMGYTEAMRETVADASGRPVLLARRLLAEAVAARLAG